MYWYLWRGVPSSTHMKWTNSHLAFLLVHIVAVFNQFNIQVNSATASNAPAMFIFGDSLADVGNNDFIPLSQYKANFFPHGIDFERRVPTGRFCNGRLVLDILASQLGFPSPLRYLSPNTRGSALLQGVNYASAGCGILNETSNNSNGCLSLSTQLGNHQNTVNTLLGQLGVEETQDFLTKSLHFVVIGSNDFLGNFLMSNTGDVSQFIDRLVSALDNGFRMLYSQNARHMVLVGLGPLGCVPSQRAKAAQGNCNEELNGWVGSLNVAMQTLVTQLDSEFADAKITFANPYKLGMDFIQNPATYGFNVTTAACCGGGRLKAQTACLPASTFCSNRSSHLFWDPWHPTEAANIFIANALLSPTSSILVAPWSLMQVAAHGVP